MMLCIIVSAIAVDLLLSLRAESALVVVGCAHGLPLLGRRHDMETLVPHLGPLTESNVDALVTILICTVLNTHATLVGVERNRHGETEVVSLLNRFNHFLFSVLTFLVFFQFISTTFR